MKKRRSIMLLVILGIFILSSSVAIADDPLYPMLTGDASAEDVINCKACHLGIVENFTVSLHYTGAGMYGEYDKYAMKHFDLNTTEYYEEWNCQKCHVSTCEKCHKGGHNYEITLDTCDTCHKKKQSATYMGDMPAHKSQGPHADIHYEKGLICTDCHNADEMHGTGEIHGSQLDAVTTTCKDCHTKEGTVIKGMDVTQHSVDIQAHDIHSDTLDCIACHTGWSLTCNNCHLDTRKGTTFSSDEFYLGVGSDGLVKPFIKMDAMYNNETHTGYGEWFSHTVTDQPKDCDFCHENSEVLCEGCEGDILGTGGSLMPQEMIDRVLAMNMTSTPIEVPTVESPGFEAIFAIAAIAVIAYAVMRRRGK